MEESRFNANTEKEPFRDIFSAFIRLAMSSVNPYSKFAIFAKNQLQKYFPCNLIPFIMKMFKVILL